MGWHSQGALTLPPAPPHPLATLSWGCYLNGPLCHSKRVSAASCALLHALTLRLTSEYGRCGFRWHRCGPRARLGRDHARRLSALVQARRSRRGNHGGNTRLRRLRGHNRSSGRSHSITLSARSTRPAGTSCPIALAVLRLITSSNVVGCSTGRSVGFAPLSILATIRAR